MREVNLFSSKNGMVALAARAAMLLLLLSGCYKNHNHELEEPEPKRTILVYMAGRNNLTTSMKMNMRDMALAMNPRLSRYFNLVIYADFSKEARPVLLQVKDSKIDTLWRFEKRPAVEIQSVKDAIEVTKELFPTQEYGLILSSHGTGWLNQRVHNYVDPQYDVVKSSSFKPEEGMADAFLTLPYSMNSSYPDNLQEPYTYMGSRLPYDLTKAFGYDSEVKRWMDIGDLASALPDHMFDFIFFDACFMGSIEVCYELRSKANTIIASAYEIPIEGMPYSRIMEALFNSKYEQACMACYEYYSKKTGFEQTSGLGIVKTDGLDSLATLFRRVADQYHALGVSEKEKLFENRDSIQLYDRFWKHVSYDFLNIAGRAVQTPELREELFAQYDRCVPYRKSTAYICAQIKINSFSGLSMYLPNKYYSQTIDPYYLQTEWNQKVGWVRETP